MDGTEFKRGDFITYYEPVVKAHCVINIQDWYKSRNKENTIDVKRWVFYKALNLENGHLYYDGSKMSINFCDYSPVRQSTPEEVSKYLEALKKEGLTL